MKISLQFASQFLGFIVSTSTPTTDALATAHAHQSPLCEMLIDEVDIEILCGWFVPIAEVHL